MKQIKIEHIIINEKSPPVLIAEAGVNHECDIEKAKRMIEAAAKCGAGIIKFQTYKADKLASKNSPLYWADSEYKSQYDVFKKLDKFGESEFKELYKHCRKNNIVFLSTPFDEESVDILDEIGMPCFKIASADITNFPLIEYVAEKGKPVILSTGASTIKEIRDAVKLINEKNLFEIILLHCILCYPTPYEYANLGMITSLRDKFPDYPVGYSDHTITDETYLIDSIAVALGAKVVEKHFTLDKSLPGGDHYHSADPKDLKQIIKNINFTHKLLGDYVKQPIPCEENAIKYARRSLVAREEIQKGVKIERHMLTCKRPGTGISPKYINKVIGKIAKTTIRKDEQLKLEMLKSETKKRSSDNSG